MTIIEPDREATVPKVDPEPISPWSPPKPPKVKRKYRKLADFYDAAADRMEQGGWQAGSFGQWQRDTGPVCALGAMHYAAGVKHTQTPEMPTVLPSGRRYRRAVKDFAKYLVPTDRAGGGGEYLIWTWNDRHSHAWASGQDVIDAFRERAEALRSGRG